jgi:hypothetical protein
MKTPTILIAILTAIMPFVANGQNSEKRVHIQVAVNQPNIEDCYRVGIPDVPTNTGDTKLYPNPNKGMFKLEIANLNPLDNIAVDAYNINGGLVYQFSTIFKESSGENCQNLSLDLNLTHLPSGIYFVHIGVEQKRTIQKLVIL